MDNNEFYKFALDIFIHTGHYNTKKTIYENHNIREFLYLDNEAELTFTKFAQNILKCTSNISYLFNITKEKILHTRLKIKESTFIKKIPQNIHYYSFCVENNDCGIDNDDLIYNICRIMMRVLKTKNIIFVIKSDNSFVLVISNRYLYTIPIEKIEKLEKYIDIANMLSEDIDGFIDDIGYSLKHCNEEEDEYDDLLYERDESNEYFIYLDGLKIYDLVIDNDSGKFTKSINKNAEIANKNVKRTIEDVQDDGEIGSSENIFSNPFKLQDFVNKILKKQ